MILPFTFPFIKEFALYRKDKSTKIFQRSENTNLPHSYTIHRNNDFHIFLPMYK